MLRNPGGYLGAGRDLVFGYGLYVLLAALIVLFGLISHSFLTVSNWTQISIEGCFLLTASAGLTLVMVTGNIDVSVGSVAYLAAAAVYLTADYSFGVSVLAAVAVGVVAGLLSGFLVSYCRMNSLLTTLGLMIAYRGISLLVTGGTMHPVGQVVARLGRIEFFDVLPVVFLVSLGVVVILQIVLSQTKFGAYCYAIGNSEGAAAKLGIPVRAVKLAAFCISGVCGALSGLLSSMYLGEITTFTGRGMEFQAVAAAVIGGTSLFGGRGNVLPGTFAGVLLLIVISNGLGTRGVSPYVYPFAAGVIIFLAIYLDSLKHARPLDMRAAT
jgi:ribose/xylose/arabinose/galactoside ABC-type transport system permease subunit